MNHDLILKAPAPQVLFNTFGDNSLNFEVKIFVTETTNAGRNRIIHDLHMQIDQICRANGIEISFPQRDLHLKSSDVVFKVEHVTRGEGTTV